MANERDLRRIARLKVELRKTDEEIADIFGVSRRTIQRWMKSSEYIAEYRQAQQDLKEEARGKIATLGEEVVATLHSLMSNAKSDFVKLQAAQTLGTWLGLDKPVVEEETNEAEEVVALLQKVSERLQAPQVDVLPPVLPGGRIQTDDVIDAEVVEDESKPQ